MNCFPFILASPTTNGQPNPSSLTYFESLRWAVGLPEAVDLAQGVGVAMMPYFREEVQQGWASILCATARPIPFCSQPDRAI